ncbi:MAG TPA: hypothetical protein VFN61_01940 [Acidimicrobiales bacterium]|nr:hypothetical protein [Acidimicrobiales bacterium]
MSKETAAQRTMREQREVWEQLAQTIDEVVRFKRIGAGFLASQMGMTRQGVWNKLRGHSKITPWEADGFAVALGVPRSLLDLGPKEALLALLTGDYEDAESQNLKVPALDRAVA